MDNVVKATMGNCEFRPSLNTKTWTNSHQHWHSSLHRWALKNLSSFTDYSFVAARQCPCDFTIFFHDFVFVFLLTEIRPRIESDVDKAIKHRPIIIIETTWDRSKVVPYACIFYKRWDDMFGWKHYFLSTFQSIASGSIFFFIIFDRLKTLITRELIMLKKNMSRALTVNRTQQFDLKYYLLKIVFAHWSS